MGIYLEEVEIEIFRGIFNYKISNLGKWSSITGKNSTSKSSVTQSILLLGSNEMHNYSDIPSDVKFTDIDYRDIEIRITYLFKLEKNFDELMNDKRIYVSIKSWNEHFINKYSDSDDSFINSLKKSHEYSLKSLQTDGTIKKILNKALYEAIRGDIEERKTYGPYKPLFHPSGHFKMPEEIFDKAKYFKIIMGLSHRDGPNYKFYLLDEKKEILVDNEVFYEWFDYQKIIAGDTHITFAQFFGEVFLKGVTKCSKNKDEQTFPKSFLLRDCSNLETYLEYCLNYDPEILKKLEEYFNYVIDSPIAFKKGLICFQSEEEILVNVGNSNEWFSIKTLSDGLFNLLVLLIQIASCKKGDILVIDEPELHLHPGSAKRLRDILFKMKSEIQIICVTHSPIFLDPSFVDTIILNQNVNGSIEPKILTSEEVDMALSDLGSSGIDLLLYDVIIWVEGPSDVIYLRNWVNLVAKDLGIKLSSQIGFLAYGGDSVKNLNISEVKKINRKSIFVVDSDKESENAASSQKSIDLQKECNNHDTYCWITYKREIENYIPVNLLKSELCIGEEISSISDYDDVMKTLNPLIVGKKNKSKVSVASKIAPKMTIDHIKKDSCLYGELKPLVEKIVSFQTY